jgi:hypothetical protein
MTDTKQDGGKGLAPPYVAFSTTKTFFGTLKEHGVPGRIDRSVLGNFSGQVGSQLMVALRFLNLTDGEGHPTPRLTELVSAYGTDEWPAALGSMLKGAYGPLMQTNLATATPQQFNDKFRDLYPAEGDTLRKCMTFFLGAAQEANIPISPYIMKNKKPRTAPTKRKAAKPKTTQADHPADVAKVQQRDDSNGDGAGQGNGNGSGGQGAAKTAEQVLFELLHHEMETDEKQAVFTLLLYLKKPKKNGGAP